jgi:large subunit ribosomal protein L23
LEIKKAIEAGFKVAVKSVNTMCFEGKKKRDRRNKYGKRPDWKKAVVTLKEGSKIELT